MLVKFVLLKANIKTCKPLMLLLNICGFFFLLRGKIELFLHMEGACALAIKN
jgi:hypothetical protein